MLAWLIDVNGNTQVNHADTKSVKFVVLFGVEWHTILSESLVDVLLPEQNVLDAVIEYKRTWSIILDR